MRTKSKWEAENLTESEVIDREFCVMSHFISPHFFLSLQVKRMIDKINNKADFWLKE